MSIQYTNIQRIAHGTLRSITSCCAPVFLIDFNACRVRADAACSIALPSWNPSLELCWILRSSPGICRGLLCLPRMIRL